MVFDIREFPVKTKKNTLQAPNIADVPYPIHEGQLRSEDHMGDFAVWHKHSCLLV